MTATGDPIIVVGAGLPHLPAVLSASKSYSERLFRYPRIDRLTRDAADLALRYRDQGADELVFYDIADRLAHGNARPMATLDDLLAEADVVSLHVDGRPGNAGLFGAAEFAAMKPRALFINASRGSVVDLPALVDALRTRKLAGAALDVYPSEPGGNGDYFTSGHLGGAHVNPAVTLGF